MSRAINTSLATIQFQVNARQANAAMQALQEASNDLNRAIDSVNRNIANLGKDVPKDNPQLLNYQNQLKGLQKDLKDVEKAQRDFLKGAKAADQLWQAATNGNIESLSFRSIKAGVNGLKKRQEGLSPGDAQDMKDWRIIKDVIDEADRVMKQAGADVQNVVQTIREGGKVSEQTMRQTINTLKELKGSVDETDADFRTWGSDLDFMEGKLQEFSDAQRRARGEIVDANDARREMNKLTEEGAAAAKREAEEADRLVQQYKAEGEELVKKRNEIKANIEDTQKQIDENHKLIEEKHRQLAADEETFNAEQQGRRTTIDGLKEEARLRREEANEKADAAEQQRRVIDLQAQTGASQETLNEGEKRYIQLLGEATEAGNKAAAAETKLADAQSDATQKQVEFNQKQKEGLDNINQMAQGNQALQQSIDGLNGELEQNSKDIADNANKATEAEQKKQQAQQLTIKRMEEMLAVMQKEFREEATSAEQRKALSENIKIMEQALKEAKGETMSTADAMRVFDAVTGQLAERVESVSSRVSRATSDTRSSIAGLDTQINTLNGEISALDQHMRTVGSKSTDLNPFVQGITDSTKALQEQKAERQEFIDQFKQEAEERAKSIQTQKEQIALVEKERDENIKTIDQRIKAQQENLTLLQTLHPQTETFTQMSQSLEQEIAQLKAEREAIINSTETKEKLARMNEQLAASIKADENATAESQIILDAFDQKIEQTKKAIEDLAHAAQGFDSEELKRYSEEMTSLNENLQQQRKLREEYIATFEREKAERAQAIEKQKEQIALLEKERTEALNSVNARLQAAEQTLAQLKELPDELRGQAPVDEMVQTQLRVIRELQKERFNIASEAEQRLADMNQKLADSIKADQEALAQGNAVIQGFDVQIGQLESAIESYKQKLANAKSPVDAKELEDSAQKMGELQAQLSSLTEQRSQYIEKLRQEADEATRLAEAEKAAALAEQEGVSLDDMRLAVKTLQDAQSQEKNADVYRQQGEAIDVLTQKIKEATGEWMSFADAEKMAQQAGKDTFLNKEGKGFIASPEEIQKATQALERRRDALIKNMKTSGEATKEQERELADLTKKIKDLKFEQDNLNMSQEKMQMLMRTPTNAVSLDELRAAIKRADAELKRMEGSLGQNNAQYKAFAEQVKNAKNMLKEMEGQAKASATAWEKAWSRLKTYVVMYMGFNAVWQKMVGTADDILELSDKLGEVRKTTGFTADEVGRLSDNLSKIDTRTPLNELLSLSVAAGQLGLKTQEDVQGFTEAANKLMVALPEMGKEAATEMMKVALATGEVKRIQEQMDEGLVEGSSATAVAIEKIGSTIDRLRASSAAAAPQITDFVKRVGAVGAQSGITIDQVAALGSTVDALGMRVEMSATALSRMIPAIKRNAFEVAKAIGMAPNALRQMFDEAGGGMNAMLAIFQHIKDSGMNANDIEQMLGMGGMADIMKDLNQQGARAGIVFAGLSQNVDVLREHLGIARTAYEENTAIQAEYDRMNETSAAKWERLKNTIEEMFVGDRSQKFFGFIIDGLRYVVDLINGPLQGAFQATIVSVGLIKTGLTGVFGEFGKAWDYLKDSAAAAEKALQEAANATNKISEATSGVEEAADVVGDIGEALEGAQEAGEQAGEAVGAATGAIEGMSGAAKVSIFSINGLKTAWKGLDATMKANIIVMVIALLYTLGKAIYDMVTETTKANKALGEANALIAIAIDRFEGYWAKLKETKTALDEATKSTEGLKEGSEDLAKATGEVVKAKEAHKSAMAEMNGLYGKYLGFMLTEANYANLNAAAHDKVTAAIRREMLAKQQQAAIDNVVQENMEDMKDGLANLSEELREEGRLNTTQAGQAKIAMQNFMRENFTADGDEIQIAEGAYKFLQQKGGNMGKLKKLDANQIAAAWYYEYLKDTFHLDKASLADITGVFPQGGSYRNTNVGGRHFRGDYAQAYLDNMQDVAEITSVFAGDMGAAEKEDRKSTTDLMKGFQAQIKKAESQINDKSLSEKERNAAYEDLANSLEGLDANIGLLDPKKDKKLIDSIKQQADNLSKTVDANKLTRARNNARSIFQRVTGDVQGDFPIQPLEPEKNSWGSKLEASSTDWKNMTAEQLVNRRKQMKDFVNAIQTDSDVKTVLAEDQALAAAIKKGMASDMRTVIEWYNDQRLKIQDELHARHLTNTGDWMDPKKQKAAKKQFQNEVKEYLEELDAYYTERNQEIQTARNNEEITEAEAWRRTINNETEWYNRRAELQKLYAEKGAEVTKEEQDAIFAIIAERTGDSTTFIQQMIGKTIEFAKEIEKTGEKGAAVVHKWRADLGLGYEKDFLKSAKSIGKQMKFIEDTLAKERPYDGITKNLQENLDKMGVLAAQYKRINDELVKQGKEPKYSDAEITAQTYKEMAFFLKQAEEAWSIDIDELLRRMAKKGMEATAEEISKSELLKQAVMGQLRKTFEEVQNAVKKEASQIKKDVEIWWNDDMRGPNGMSMKSAYDQVIARLGRQQDSVSRANSFVGAGAASDNVAARLAMKQIEMQMRMQKAQFDMYRVQANQRMDALKREAEEHRRIAAQMKKEGQATEAELELLKAENAERDAANVKKSLGLTLAEETKKEEENIANLLKLQEESQYRLYQSLKEWADLLTSSIQSLMEASNAGNEEYYNERAKLDLTGKGGPGAGTYVVIDNAGTSDATAHYEYLSEREALERQRDIEQENAEAEAWKKVMDDINMKMSEEITDWINASMQNYAIDMNTEATRLNTNALRILTERVSQAANGNGANNNPSAGLPGSGFNGAGGDSTGNGIYPSAETGGEADTNPLSPLGPSEGTAWTCGEIFAQMNEQMVESSNNATNAINANFHSQGETAKKENHKIQIGTESMFAKMTSAANMYGMAYQVMSNNNLSTSQKVQLLAVQAAGQAAISALTATFAETTAETTARTPSVFAWLWSKLGWGAIPVFALFTGGLGALMGLATSAITKSKSQIAKVTGASVSAGRLATGMQTYAEGNVNEMTDPSTLTPGRHYNVDGSDGKTYRARYMGEGAKTHITSGPEFHLVGEKGQEAIIDAHTTRLIRMNDTGIWRDIQTLYNGGSLSAVTRRRRGRGMKAFAEGNLEELDGAYEAHETNGTYVDLDAMTEAMNRQSAVQEALLERLREPIVAQNIWTGPDGIPNMYNKMQKEAVRHGVKYL